METLNIDSIAIHESKNSEKVIKFVNLTITDLSKYCSANYAKRILMAYDNGLLNGIYFTNSGRIKATIN